MTSNHAVSDSQGHTLTDVCCNVPGFCFSCFFCSVCVCVCMCMCVCVCVCVCMLWHSEDSWIGAGFLCGFPTPYPRLSGLQAPGFSCLPPMHLSEEERALQMCTIEHGSLWLLL